VTQAAKQKSDPIGVPDIVLLLTEQLAVIDNLAGHLYLVVYADPTVSGQTLDQLLTTQWQPWISWSQNS